VEVQSIQGRHDVITTFSKFPVYVRERAGKASGQIVTTGDILPCHLSAGSRSRVEDVVLGAHKVLPLGDGVTHTEVKLGSSGPEIIEVNCRVGGHLSRLLKRRTGFDLVRQAMLIAGGRELQALPGDAGGRSVAGMFVPFATDEGPVMSSVSPSSLRAAGAASVDEIARQGASRSETDGIACNVVLDCATDEELRRTVAEVLVQSRKAFAEDGLGRRDWAAAMIERLAPTAPGGA